MAWDNYSHSQPPWHIYYSVHRNSLSKQNFSPSPHISGTLLHFRFGQSWVPLPWLPWHSCCSSGNCGSNAADDIAGMQALWAWITVCDLICKLLSGNLDGPMWHAIAFGVKYNATIFWVDFEFLTRIIIYNLFSGINSVVFYAIVTQNNETKIFWDLWMHWWRRSHIPLWNRFFIMLVFLSFY